MGGSSTPRDRSPSKGETEGRQAAVMELQAQIETLVDEFERPEPEPPYLQLGSPRPANEASPDPGINPRVP